MTSSFNAQYESVRSATGGDAIAQERGGLSKAKLLDGWAKACKGLRISSVSISVRDDEKAARVVSGNVRGLKLGREEVDQQAGSSRALRAQLPSARAETIIWPFAHRSVTLGTAH